MERKFFEYSKKGFKEFQKEYPNCETVLTVLRNGKLYITSGEGIEEQGQEKMNLK